MSNSDFTRPEGLAWLILLCIATVSLLLFYLVLLHFRTLLRSLDLCLAGLMVRNVIYCLVAAPTLVHVALSGSAWTLATCRLLVFSLHMPLLTSLVGTAFFAVDRLFLLRKDGGPIYNGWVTNKVKPLLLVSIFCCAAFITGLIPVNLWTRVTAASVDDNQQLRCRFLPSQLDFSYSMVLLACSLASAVFCAVCCFDGLLFLRQQHRRAKLAALAAAQSGSQTVSPTSTLQNGASSGSLKSHQLRRSAEFDAHKHSWESWRVTSLANAVIFFCNHLTLMILDFANLVALRDGSGSEYITLLLVESIVLPNSMWLFAVRYRHVVKRYFAKITRQPNLLDDRYCAMQMFQKRCTLMGSMYRGHRARSLASTYYDSSTVDRRQQNSQGRQSRNGRLAKIQDVGHVTMGLGRGGELNHGYSPTHHPLDSSSAASSFNNDPLTHSTGSTGTEWDAVQLHQLHQQPVSSGEQVRAVVHPLGTLPEQRKEEEAAAKDAAKEADDEENRIDAVIVCTTEMAAEDSPTAVPTVTATAGTSAGHRSSSGASSSGGSGGVSGFYYLSPTEKTSRKVAEEDDQEVFTSDGPAASVTNYRRPQRQPNALETAQFPPMYVNPLMRSVSGFSDDFSSLPTVSGSMAAKSESVGSDQVNNLYQELDSYL